MILPANYTSALLLLVLSFLCLGSWVNTFKLAGSRWRFELYSIDFAIGLALISILAAFTLGTSGSDLAFSDRMLVAGRASQAFVLAGGFLFNLGNMLLLAAVSLLGISGAFPISIGCALIISSFFSFRGTNVLFLSSGIVLLIVSVLLDVAACRIRDRSYRRTVKKSGAATEATPSASVQGGTKVAARTTSKPAPKPANRKTGKGIFVAVLAGVILGFFLPVSNKGMTGELALGPYAGMLMFSVGAVISTLVFDFYFLNIAIEGGRLSYSAYFQGMARQHFLGFAGGALWAIGALALLLALAVPPQPGLHPSLKVILPVGSVLLVLAWGSLGWREFKAAPSSAKLSLAFAAVFFACSVIVIGLGITS